ncbi:hypothetical protein EZV62_013412 [Acer yangbiense]|uniref:Uncharacterized protein n=1 Tax=Acer yangbiense TaxID=1000413 RepID=A0A5C7HZC1_9ROSI|nr:hypothetical protein EZV62_013412 [Acer yangbiense]
MWRRQGMFIGMHLPPQELRMDWNKLTKDYFLNRPTLVSVFLLIDDSILAVFLKFCVTTDKRKKKKNGVKRPEENMNDFQELIRGFFETAPPWIMTSSVTKH